jgi:hypothetical protein
LIPQHTLNERWSCKNIFQALKANICQPRLVYPTKLSLLIEGEIKPSTVAKTKRIHDYQARTEENKY